MKRVQVDYVVDDTMCRDVLLVADGRVNTKILPGGRGYVKTNKHSALYARVDRIRVSDVEADHGEEADMR